MRRPDDALDHVPQPEMAELVREHRLDLLRCEPVQQRVEEHDALRAAEAGEIRVAVARAPGAVHDEQPGRREAAAREQPLDALARVARRQRRERLKSGAMTVGYSTSTRSWNAIHATQAHSHHSAPALRISHSTSSASGKPEDGADGNALREVGEPDGASVVRLKPKRSSMRNVRHHENGSADDAADRRATPTSSSRSRTMRRDGKRLGRREEPGEAAAERDGDEHDRIDGRLQHAEPLLGDRVVGGLAVRRRIDAARERRRRRIAVRAHMRNLPRGEPEADAERRERARRRMRV